MNFGFVKVGAYTPIIKVADVEHNVEQIKKGIDEATEKKVKLVAFPELCLAGYTCGDLFYSSVLLDNSLKGLFEIARYTENKNLLVVVGLPLKVDGLIYNVAGVINNGKVIGIVPKSYLPNYNEFYEKRHFAVADDKVVDIELCDKTEKKIIPFGKNIIFQDKDNTYFRVAVEICEDLWTPVPPSISHAINGAEIIVNLSCSDENLGKPKARRDLVGSHSSKIVSGYIYSNAGEGESTTDMVFSGHNLIAENGRILCESKVFSSGLLSNDIDVEYLDYERNKIFNQDFSCFNSDYKKVYFSVYNESEKANNEQGLSDVERVFDQFPFVPKDKEDLSLIIKMQVEGLKKRILHTNAKSVVIGLSGGLDSTLSLIVCAEVMKLLNRPSKDVIAITMPCFGTSSRTFENSKKLAKLFGVTFKKIDITKSVLRHFKDIKQDVNNHDVTFENAQARERTQILMDIANQNNGLVIGTGDLSELALGFATYNGDHMSNYAVNSSITKTLIRKIVENYAYSCKPTLKGVLLDVIETPVSPELLPSQNEKIDQKTEEIVGPYTLHDFFLYNFIKNGYSPKKIYYVAKYAFKDEYSGQTILKWLKLFFRRFFTQQFKRSCMPDGIKVGSVTLSPRGSYRMPSDAVSALWLKELDLLAEKE